MEPEALTEEERALIHDELTKVRTIEAMAERICKLISELTGNAVLVYLKRLKRVSFLNHLLEELVEAHKLADFFEDEPELFIDGASRVFEQPEFQDIAKMRMLLHAFDEKLALLSAMTHVPGEDGVHVRIGRENSVDGLGEVSLVAKDCFASRIPVGSIAVMGPTRMRYSKVVSLVDFVADTVSEAAERF
jgi:heat-inducible transcriptional repressor